MGGNVHGIAERNRKEERRRWKGEDGRGKYQKKEEEGRKRK